MFIIKLRDIFLLRQRTNNFFILLNFFNMYYYICIINYTCYYKFNINSDYFKNNNTNNKFFIQLYVFSF